MCSTRLERRIARDTAYARHVLAGFDGEEVARGAEGLDAKRPGIAFHRVSGTQQQHVCLKGSPARKGEQSFPGDDGHTQSLPSGNSACKGTK